MDFLPLLKHSLYLDENIEDEYLTHLIDVAKLTIQNALDIEANETNVQFKHAVILLAGHYYENRLEASEQNIASIPFGIASIIEQLRYSLVGGGDVESSEI